MPTPLHPFPFPISVCWSKYTEVHTDSEALGRRLVILWQMRAGLPLVRAADGSALDARALTRAALLDWYGEALGSRL